MTYGFFQTKKIVPSWWIWTDKLCLQNDWISHVQSTVILFNRISYVTLKNLIVCVDVVQVLFYILYNGQELFFLLCNQITE